MSGFEEARRQKLQETKERDDAARAAETDRNLRLQSLRRDCTVNFQNHADTIDTGVAGDTLTVHRNGKDFLDITVLNGGQFKVKAGGVDARFVGTDIVRNGKTVSGNEIYRVILDWVDGDLIK